VCEHWTIRCRNQGSHESDIPIRGTASAVPPCGPSSSSSRSAGWILRPGTRFGWRVAGGGADGRRPPSPGSAFRRRRSSGPGPRRGSESCHCTDRGRPHQRDPPADYRQATGEKRGGRLRPLGAPWPVGGAATGQRRRSTGVRRRCSHIFRIHGELYGHLAAEPRQHGGRAGSETDADPARRHERVFDLGLGCRCSREVARRTRIALPPRVRSPPRWRRRG
jgi:hypothetical protein